ncbi:hypothetical protein CAPTEDRAFT_219044 [Capitella teleta]|uniref:Uncharacterized protein n=1 Tax=Capitella teleta TaxID=283909 RepID=R7TJF9_CAPTE|nr:hypothetical protein CAPTEDRAFT_219044 [Capitella teleta]|eukprot:ELT91686.1 hypothetical protein CAPTEDRAFT_219044 [Capitella teleta]
MDVPLTTLFRMDLIEIVRFGSMIIAFLLLAVLGDRKTWITTDLMITSGWGLALLAVPSVSMGFMVKSLEDPMMHEKPEEVITGLTPKQLLICRITGVVILGMTIVRYLTRESRDGTVHITILMSRVFVNSLVLMCQVYSYFLTNKGKKSLTWSTERDLVDEIRNSAQFVKAGIVGTLLWLLGTLVHLLRSNDYMTYPQHNIRLNNHLRLDAWLAMVSAIAFLAFPDYLLSAVFGITVPNAVHFHLMRGIGAFSMGEAVISMQAPGFLHERDKRAQLHGRLTTQLCLLAPCAFACYVSGIMKPKQFLFLFLLVAPVIVNALIAYFTDCTVIYRVPKRDTEVNGGKDD